ncbi:MAG: response regulator [Bdellovibrionales bacterium]|nr:response regulator [Bdellovibrionales bacterium]
MPKVLVIEDEPDTRAVIVHSLRMEGYEIAEAIDGQEAVECCHQQLPDLIVSDIMMPRMDGRQFVTWFRSTFPEPFVPILILTALTEVEQKVEGLTLGADDYLTKPFNFRELQARAKALLRVKQLTESLARRSRELQAANDELSKMQQALIKKERELVAAQMAGAAAHHLGQPITAILLHCRLLEAELDRPTVAPETAKSAIRAVQTECRYIKDILDKMKVADPNSTEAYLDGTTILSLNEQPPKEQA